MQDNTASFKSVSIEIVNQYGIETVKRWANSPDPIIADAFKRCLTEAKA